MKTNQPLFTKTSLVAHFLQGCKRFFILSILMSFLNTLMEMLIPQVIRRFVDSVIGDDPLNLPAFAEAWLARLAAPSSSQVYLRGHMYLVAILIGILALLVAFAFYGTHQSNAIAAEKLHKNIREELFAHIQKLPFAWHMKNKTGDIIQRCTSDAERVRIFIAEQMVSVVRIVIMMGLSLYFMFSMDWRLSLVAACAIPVIVGYSAFFHAKIGGSFEKCDENEGILSTIAQENLTGVRVVRAFGREEFERKRFEKQTVYYTGLWISLMKLMAVFWGIGDFISGLQVLLILVLGSVFCVRGTLSAGEFIAFLSYNMMLIWPVRQLGRVISEMSKAGVSLDRIMYIMNSPVEKDRDNAVSREETDKALKGDIVFENVNFGYEPDIPIVSDINLTIPAGSTFGILGSTGSGKSTLMHLLNRLYELPEENGKITIGGVDIADMKAEDLRRNIGMVLQEPFLFSRTISENISITNRNMTMEEIRKAAKIACVDEAIKEFKNGYDTVVGERGVTLSGGQKQRTAIARMLTSRAPVMVFDDSLSAVDAETDARIRHALSESLGDSTVILISHRITTLMQADQIMVLDKGRIVEMGTPDELLEKNGIYKKIYDMQLSLSEDETA